MKLTGTLKKKFENADTTEEKKKVLAEAGIDLTDDEVEMVTGGIAIPIYYYEPQEVPYVGNAPSIMADGSTANLSGFWKDWTLDE